MLERMNLDNVVLGGMGVDYDHATDLKYDKPRGKLAFKLCKASYDNFKKDLPPRSIKGKKVFLLKSVSFFYGMASTAFHPTVGLTIDLALFLFSDLPKGIKISKDYFKYRVFKTIRRLESGVGCLVFPFHGNLGHFLISEGCCQHGKYRKAYADIPEVKRQTKKFKQLDLDNIETSELKQAIGGFGGDDRELGEGVFSQAVTADVLTKIQGKLPDYYYWQITPKQAAGLDPLKLSERQWQNMSLEARKWLVTKKLDFDTITSSQLRTVFSLRYEGCYYNGVSPSHTVFVEAVTADVLKKIQEKLPVEYYEWVTPKQAKGLDPIKLTGCQWHFLSVEVRELLIKKLDFDSIDTNQLVTIFPRDCVVMDQASEKVFKRTITADVLKKIQDKLPAEYYDWITPNNN